MVKLWRCIICGDPYVGDTAPDNCPFCGAHKQFIKDAKAEASFDLQLGEKDAANASTALELELANAAFYHCASERTDDAEGRLLFKALAKVESEHASIWRKVLKQKDVSHPSVNCSLKNNENLKESHDRETRAIAFYKQAAAEASNPRVKQLFGALVQVENDHLKLSGERP